MSTSVATLHQNAAINSARTNATPVPMADSSSGGSSDSSSTTNSATISANDFLTLLVTEMQNQDPTNATDPNEYINQLVNVNSLEQLISINQTLTAAYPTASSSSSSSDSSSSGTASADSAKQVASAQAQVHRASSETSPSISAPTTVQGNLSVPTTKAAARRVANALSGEV